MVSEVGAAWRWIWNESSEEEVLTSTCHPESAGVIVISDAEPSTRGSVLRWCGLLPGSRSCGDIFCFLSAPERQMQFWTLRLPFLCKAAVLHWWDIKRETKINSYGHFGLSWTNCSAFCSTFSARSYSFQTGAAQSHLMWATALTTSFVTSSVLRQRTSLEHHLCKAERKCQTSDVLTCRRALRAGCLEDGLHHLQKWEVPGLPVTTEEKRH